MGGDVASDHRVADMTEQGSSMTEPVAAKELTPEQALNVLIQAAYQFKGTRQDHVLIDQAAQLLAAHLQPANGQSPKRRATPKP